MSTTHEVFNQSSPFENRNLYAVDAGLRDALRAFDGDWAATELETLGARWGARDMHELARLANEQGPVLRQFDRCGERIDELEFHPAWHELMRHLIASGAHAQPWAEPKPGAQAARAAKYYLWSQLENGTQCPATMTFAVVPVIAKQPKLAPQWLPKLLSRDYDPRSAPVDAKHGVIMGMGMTEKQGGSDVRANTTRAELAGASAWGEEYRLTGHKWFYSAPQCDAHLVLAKIDGEQLSCFFVPRLRPDGTRNAIRIQRLKPKVGNRSNASSEVEFEAASGWLVGEAGRGVATILEMGNHTRLDCSIGSAGIMRGAFTHALHHARERSAFGKRLAEQPLMRNVLADLALESEAATWLALRLARCYDADAGEHERLLRRVLTPVAKYWICKRTPALCSEAMEVLGGNGYVEEASLGRFFRESPLNSIWEGSGNIMALDLLRAMSRAPEVRDALRDELQPARGAHAGYDKALDDALHWFGAPLDDESSARMRAEQLALLLQASLLLRHAPQAVAGAFITARLQSPWRGSFGTLPSGIDVDALLARALPQ
jgi:putative acyl-CoA dehydrogenase